MGTATVGAPQRQAITWTRRAALGALVMVAAAAAMVLLATRGASAEEIQDPNSWAPPNLVIPVVDPATLQNPSTPTPEPVVETPVVPLSTQPPAVTAPEPPAANGAGRRVVYSNSRQRVWMYEADGSLVHSYPVSGRRGMPRPGIYAVFSRSTRAYSGSVHMDWMVRFAHGRNLAIGFHAIPVGRRGPIQSLGELGQFRSHGCVRQAPADARRMWDFAPLGTKVVVTA